MTDHGTNTREESIPDSHLNLLTGPVYAILTTVADDGQPENTVVWCSWDGECVLVNTVEGRRKHDNIRQNPLVAITAIDTDDPYRWVDVRGYVESVIPDEGNANINYHAKLYEGVDSYYGDIAPVEKANTEKRVIIRIKPTNVVAYPHD